MVNTYFITGAEGVGKSSLINKLEIRFLKIDSHDFDEVEIESISQDDLGLSNGPPKPERFASRKDISLIRRHIIRATVPYKDFIVNRPPIGKKPEEFSEPFICSVFYSQIPQEVFDLAVKKYSPSFI